MVLIFGVNNYKNNRTVPNENNSISAIADSDDSTAVATVNADEIQQGTDEVSENTNEYFPEDDVNNIAVPATYEEAVELMSRLQIENIIWEKIIINNEVHTVVECREETLTIGDWLVEAYNIPDISGNILSLVSTPQSKTTTYVTCIAIVEEPYISEKGNKDHWVKIRMNDSRVGWIKGEYTGLDRGGMKYQTQKNI
jgi:hypothetical protein